MQEEDYVDYTCLVDNDATHFDNSLQELRGFSSHLYQTAQYFEATFLAAQDKSIILENTKQYISTVVVAVAEHLGSISANLESCLSNTSSISETNSKINLLKMRIATCQQRSHKLTLDRFYMTADFSRHHCRYIFLPLMDAAASNVVSRNSKDGIETKSEKEDEFETEVPLFLHTHNYKPCLVQNSNSNTNSTRDMGNQKKAFSSLPVLPVRGDGQSMLQKMERPVFEFKETRKPKRSTMNWRALHSREMASLIRRGKRIIA